MQMQMPMDNFKSYLAYFENFPHTPQSHHYFQIFQIDVQESYQYQQCAAFFLDCSHHQQCDAFFFLLELFNVIRITTFTTYQNKKK